MKIVKFFKIFIASNIDDISKFSIRTTTIAIFVVRIIDETLRVVIVGPLFDVDPSRHDDVPANEAENAMRSGGGVALQRESRRLVKCDEKARARGESENGD